MLALLLLLFKASVTDAVSTSLLHFKCAKSNGTVPGILPVITLFGEPSPSMRPTAIGLSAAQCAALCARTPFQACQSYSHNPDMNFCFTRNIRTSHVGDLCGLNIGQSRERCQKFGDTMMAYGNNSRILECICGGDSTWTSVDNSNIPDLCPDKCQNSYPCTVNVRMLGGCHLCNGTVNACGSIPGTGSSLLRAICTTLPT